MHTEISSTYLWKHLLNLRHLNKDSDRLERHPLVNFGNQAIVFIKIDDISCIGFTRIVAYNEDRSYRAQPEVDSLCWQNLYLVWKYSLLGYLILWKVVLVQDHLEKWVVVDFVIDKEVHKFFRDHFLCGSCPCFLPFAIGLSFGIKGHPGVDSKWLLTIWIIRICWGLWAVDSGGGHHAYKLHLTWNPLGHKKKTNTTKHIFLWHVSTYILSWMCRFSFFLSYLI